MTSDLHKERWHALWTVYLLFLNTGILFFLLPPLRSGLPFGLYLAQQDTRFGWLQGIHALPAVLLALVGGLLLDRWDLRRTGIVSGLVMLGGNLLFNLGLDYHSMVLGRFISGIGAILLNLAAAKMLSVWFHSKYKGLAMSVLQTAWPVAAIIGYSTFAAAARAWGWQMTTLGLNFFMAFTIVTFILFAPRAPVEAGKRENRRLSDLFSMHRDVWPTALAWFCFATSMMTIFTFGPEFFSQKGWGLEAGNLLVGTLMWTASPGAFFAGWMMDRVGTLKLYLIIPSLVCGLLMAGFLTPLHPLPLMLVLGFVANSIPVAVYSLPGAVVHGSRLGLAFGVILTCSNLGNVVGPVVSGWLNTVCGGREAGIVFSVVVFFSIAVWSWAISGVKLGKQRSAIEEV